MASRDKDNPDSETYGKHSGGNGKTMRDTSDMGGNGGRTREERGR